MSKKLPFVKSDIPRDLRMFLDRVRELVSGSGGDRLISADELASGVLTGSLVAPTQSFMAAPPAPTDVSATAAVRSIFVEWDAPAYSGHAYAEVWSASTNSLAAAVLLGMAPGSIYVDDTGPGVTRYYWVRFVNTNDVKGPYNATSGVTATTGPEVAYLLTTLTGSITESQLFSTLGTRINLIDGAASVAGSVNARVATEAAARATAISAEAAARAAAISAEATTRANAISAEATTRAQAILDEAAARAAEDGALQTQIDLLSAAGSGDFTELLAAVQEEQTARIAADAAEAASRQTLAAQLRGDYTGTDPSALTTGLVYNEQQARVSAEGAISSSVTALSSTVTNNYNTLNSAITSEATTRASADTTLTSTINALTSTVNSNNTTTNAAITSEATTRANADTAITNTVTTLTSTVNSNNTAVNAAILAEANTRADADTALSGQITTLTASVGSNTAAITSEATARADADTAITNTVTALTSAVNSNNTAVNAAITSEATTRANADTTLSNTVTALTSTVNSNNTAVNAAISAEATTRANADTALSNTVTALTSTVNSNNTAVNAAISAEATTRANADTAISNTVTALTSTVNSNNTAVNAAISAEATTRATADTALASSVTTLQSKVITRPNLLKNGGFETGLDNWTASGPNASSWRTEDGIWGRVAITSGAAINGIGSLSSGFFDVFGGATYIIHGDALLFADSGYAYFDLLFYDASNNVVLDGGQNSKSSSFDFSNNDSNRAAMAVEVTAPANAVRCIARYVFSATNGTVVGCRMIKVERGTLPYTPYSLETTSTSISASVQTEVTTRASETGSLFAKYTVKIDTNGYVSGFGLASTANNATPFSDFIIRADRFSIASPSGPSITPIIPFIVNTTTQLVNGVSVPAGVYMDAAFIKNGTITNAKIGNAAIDDAKITNLSVGKLTAGSIAADQYIQSSNYVANTSGFRLDANGNAYLQNAVVRGAVFATSGTFAGSLSAATGTFAGALSAATGTFSGALSAATGTFSGDLSAATGTFTGGLNVNSATSGARMEIKNNVIKVFDASGTLRVQIGDLSA